MQVQISTAIKRDVEEFLIPMNLMDYSLLLGVKDVDISGIESRLKEVIDVNPTTLATRGAPYIQLAPDGDDEKVRVFAIGIIDFLQDWTAGKKIAQKIKCAETNKATIPPPEYGARFVEMFATSGRATFFKGAVIKPEGTFVASDEAIYAKLRRAFDQRLMNAPTGSNSDASLFTAVDDDEASKPAKTSETTETAAGNGVAKPEDVRVDIANQKSM